MHETLKIFTLGSFSFQQGDAPVGKFISRKVDALVVYLACNRYEHPREILAEMLWNDMPSERSMGNLRTALSSLQQHLAPYLLITRQTIGFKPDSNIWMDIHELATCMDEAESFWRRSDKSFPMPVARRLKNALALYHGDFLAGFHVRNARDLEDWIMLTQKRLRQRTENALAHLGSYFLECGRYTEGISIGDKLIEIDTLSEVGHHLLMRLFAQSGQTEKALEQYKTYSHLLQKEMHVPPSKETVELYKSIQSGEIQAATAVSTPQHNLPTPATPFVDRPDELRLIEDRLDNPACRLLTLIGQGGTGKTRLALQAALERLLDYRQGIFFIDLSPLSTVAALPSEVSRILKIPTENTTPEEAIITHLSDKEMLLVLDNFEHLLDGAEFLSRILRHVSNIKLLVTSRERLNIQEEWLVTVDGLSIPKTINTTNPERYSAVQLFVQAANRIQSKFTLSGNETSVIRICQLVEGLPLGIELAAAWLRVMSCQQIADYIETDLAYLATSLRNIPERHRSISALFEQSWRLLSQNEKDVLMRLSVFRGGFTLEAAQAVAGASLPVLLSLFEKSLIRGEVSKRYDMHDLMRRCAITKLQEAGEEETTQHAHWQYYYERLQDFALKESKIDLSPDHADLIAALECTRDAEYFLRFTSLMSRYWLQFGALWEGHYWLGLAFQRLHPGIPPELRARVLRAIGSITSKEGKYIEAEEYLQEALRLYRELKAEAEIARTLTSLSYIFTRTGKHHASKRSYQEVLSIGREINDEEMVITGLGNLGSITTEMGDWPLAQMYLEEAIELGRTRGSKKLGALLSLIGKTKYQLKDFLGARAYYEEALSFHKELNSVAYIAATLWHLGEITHQLGHYEQAFHRYRESMEIMIRFGDKFMMIQAIEGFACLAVDQNAPRRAAILFSAAETSRSILGTPVNLYEQQRHGEFIRRTRSMIDEELFMDAWQTGCEMSLEEAINYSMEDSER